MRACATTRASASASRLARSRSSRAWAAPSRVSPARARAPRKRALLVQGAPDRPRRDGRRRGGLDRAGPRALGAAAGTSRSRARQGPRAQELEREPTTRVTVRCSPAVQEKWLIAREFAERVAGQRLSAADALEAVAAEVFSAIAIDPAFVAEPEPPPTRAFGEDGEDGDPRRARRCPARAARELPRAVSALAEGLDEADAFEVDRRLRRAVRLEQTLDAAIAPLLRVVTSAEYEWSTECWQPLARYAPESLGMSARKARALLRLERACEVCPELRGAYRRGRLSWVKAQCLLPLLLLDIDGEYRSIWVAWAERTRCGASSATSSARCSCARATTARGSAASSIRSGRRIRSRPKSGKCVRTTSIWKRRRSWCFACRSTSRRCSRACARRFAPPRADPTGRVRRRGLRRASRRRAALLDAARPRRAVPTRWPSAKAIAARFPAAPRGAITTITTSTSAGAAGPTRSPIAS